MQNSITNIFVHPSVMSYIVHIVEATRNNNTITVGVSPRSTLALLRVCQSYAAIKGLTYVTPDIVKLLAPHVLSHRLVLRNSLQGGKRSKDIMKDILEHTSVPTEDFKR